MATQERLGKQGNYSEKMVLKGSLLKPVNSSVNDAKFGNVKKRVAKKVV